MARWGRGCRARLAGGERPRQRGGKGEAQPLAVAGGARGRDARDGRGREHSNNNSEKLRAAVTVAGILEHESALSDLRPSGGNRLAGAPGYDESAEYVAERAAAAGFDVSRQEFEYDLDFLADFRPPVLSIVPAGRPRVRARHRRRVARRRLRLDVQVALSRHHGAGVGDRSRPRPGRRRNTNTSGCEAADYAGVPAGRDHPRPARHLHLRPEVLRSRALGAGGMMFINEGQPGRTVPLWFNFDGIEIPTCRRTVDTAAELANGVEQGDTGLTARVQDRLAPGDLHDAERDRRDARRRPEQRDRGRRAPRLRRRRARASTTTAPARRRSSRSPSR